MDAIGVDIVGYLIFACAMVGTPGPANMVLLAAGARFGLRASLPFAAGVILGKQLIIWPIGFGLMALAASIPILFTILKWGSAAYILYLATRIAMAKIVPGQAGQAAPGFASGLIVHPMNPKAWAMITAGYTNFIPDGMGTFQATLTTALVFLAAQSMLQPLWCWGGERIAAIVSGKPAERWVMLGLAAATALSVIYVLAKEGM
ncbi:MAG: LysE family transporter [Pseudomonadota bacterium]